MELELPPCSLALSIKCYAGCWVGACQPPFVAADNSKQPGKMGRLTLQGQVSYGEANCLLVGFENHSTGGNSGLMLEPVQKPVGGEGMGSLSGGSYRRASWI